MSSQIYTPLLNLFPGLKHPILLAGMNQAAGPELAAAVCNAGGLGSIGGIGYSPAYLRSQIQELKNDLVDKNAPFGIDLLLPKVGEGARATNKDYTGGHLDELISIIIEERAALFISAVGVPPKAVVDRLHAAGIICFNMVGAEKHCSYALDVGMDGVICQGSEGGGHTGETPYNILLPACVAACKGKISPLTGKPVTVIAAGGIYNGAGLASALAYGADGVWVGTRFVCAEESGASRAHQEAIISASHGDTIRSLIFTGRPLRVRKTPFIMDWEENKKAEMEKLLAAGTVPVGYDTEERPYLMGQVAAMIHDVLPAKVIVEQMINEAAEIISNNASFINAKL